MPDWTQGTITGNSTDGTDGTHLAQVTTTGGGGTGMTLNFRVLAGVVTDVNIAAAGTGYADGDTVTVVEALFGSTTGDLDWESVYCGWP